MKVTRITRIAAGQDGAIYGGFLFRFDAKGGCKVYKTADLRIAGETATEFASFVLDKVEILKPHSNAVSFGNEYYENGDEFPLLYTNIYNNHAGEQDPQKGVCCVYRLQRKNDVFTTKLVQVIKIGFIDDVNYWKSSETVQDVRPYGNFAIDAKNGVLYAFVMRDACEQTRYFAFDLPKATDGETDEKTGAKKVTLQVKDIKTYFDCPYHHYVQGACVHNGKIYSLEGFTHDEKNPPAIRIIDMEKKGEERYVPCADLGLKIEPEFIDFEEDVCWYSELNGSLFTIDF